MPTADINGIRYYYEISGEGDPIVLITGFGGDTRFWRRATEILSDRFTVISVDNRGSGKTEYDGDVTIDLMADDVVALLEHLNFGSAHILGWSMGSHVAQNIAIRHPKRVRTLTLVSTYRRRPSRTAYILGTGVDEMEKTGSCETFSRLVNGLGYTEDYFRMKEERNSPIKMAEYTDLKKIKDQFAAINSHDTTDTASEIKAPTFCVHGMDDIMVDVREGDALADMIAGCERLRIPDVGHLVPSDDYIPQVIDFIERH